MLRWIFGWWCLGLFSHMMAEEQTVWIGTFTRPTGGAVGIYRAALDPVHGTWSGPAVVAATVQDPSWLAWGAQRRTLYATAVRDKVPLVTAYRVTVDGGLESLGGQPTTGRVPCALEVVGRVLVAVTYVGGTVEAFPLSDDDAIGPASSVLRLEHASQRQPKRQEKPHPHGVTVLPGRAEVLVPDLGADRLYRVGVDASGTLAFVTAQPWLDLPPGCGPRHAAVTPDGRQVLVIGELDSSLQVVDLADDGRLALAQSLPLLPADWTGKNSAAEILIHPQGQVAWATNRGQDALAILRRGAAGVWSVTGHIPCGGRTPRHATLADAGRLLLCGHQDDHTVAVFRVDGLTGALTPVPAPPLAVGQPVCLLP